MAIMFEPVSPSGTGKTLSALTSSTCRLEAATAARKAPRRPAPSHDRRAIGPEDVRPAVGEVGRTGPVRGPRLRWLAAGMELEPRDADRQVVDLAPEAGADRVPDRQINLTGNFRNRQTMGDTEPQPDPELASGDRDAKATRPLLDPAEHAVDPVAGEPGDAIRAERHAPDDVDHGTARHERPTTDGLLRHRPSLNSAHGATPGSARGAWYSTAPFGPDRPARSFLNILEVLMARSCAICGKVSMGGYNPQSTGSNRVRAHRRMQPNLQPFVLTENGVATKASSAPAAGAPPRSPPASVPPARSPSRARDITAR